jgi:hypothetical protein
MVSRSTRTAAMDALDRLKLSPSNSGPKKNSFSQQLGTVLAGHLNRAVTGSRAGSSVNGAPGQNSGGRQILAGVTAKSTAEEIPTMLGMGPVRVAAPVQYKGSPTHTQANASASIPTMLGMGPVAGTAPVAVVTTTIKVPAALTTDPQPVGSPMMTEGDAYWAAQPAAVQVLRGMPDNEAKDKLALSLAGQGYQIDTQIMVWNWDPQMTMQVRANQGYAWVPSFGQSNIPVGPGVSDPFEPVSYNPASPPPGSIKVSTAFAVGTIENPLVQIPASNT